MNDIQVDTDDDADRERVLAILRREGVVRVIGGMETGAYYADRFNNALGLIGNDWHTRDDRRQKAAQQIAWGDLGIPTLLTRNLDDIRRFVMAQPWRQIVLKPNMSSGGDGVEFFDRNDVAGIIAAATAMLAPGRVDAYGHPLHIVVQPRINGVEYVANTFTYNGETILLGFWRYYRVQLENGRQSYFIDRAVPLESPEGREVARRMHPLMHRIGNHIGPGHTEIMQELDETTGRPTGRWFPIESGARLPGTAISLMENRIWGTSTMVLNLLLTFDRPAFEREFARLRDNPPRMLQQGAIASIISMGEGRIREGTLDMLRALPGYSPPDALRLGRERDPVWLYELEDGARTTRTVDMNTSAGDVYLVGTDAVVGSSIGRLLEMQTNNQIIAYDSIPACYVQLTDQMRRAYRGIW